MTAIEELLDADAHNVECARQVVRQLDPTVLDLVDDAAAMYTTFCRCMGQSDPFGRNDADLSRVAQELAVTLDELMARVNSDEQLPQLTVARAAWKQVRANCARAIVVLACQRQFMWGVTDLLRGRVTPAIGYARQQAEGAALLHLFRDNPSAAIEWREISSDAEGVTFHKKYQHQLKAMMTTLHLGTAYAQGSGAALHVRLASVARGLSWLTPTESREGRSGAISVGLQELDPSNPFRYYLAVLHFLHTQLRVFEAVTLAFPEVYDPIWTERLRKFGERVGTVRAHIRSRYKDEIRDLEAA